MGINSLLAIPDDNHDFFAVPLSNVIPDVSGGATDLLAQKFCSTGHCITKVGLSDMASYDQEGTNYAEPVSHSKLPLNQQMSIFKKPNLTLWKHLCLNLILLRLVQLSTL